MGVVVGCDVGKRVGISVGASDGAIVGATVVGAGVKQSALHTQSTSQHLWRHTANAEKLSQHPYIQLDETFYYSIKNIITAADSIGKLSSLLNSLPPMNRTYFSIG